MRIPALRQNDLLLRQGLCLLLSEHQLSQSMNWKKFREGCRGLFHFKSTRCRYVLMFWIFLILGVMRMITPMSDFRAYGFESIRLNRFQVDIWFLKQFLVEFSELILQFFGENRLQFLQDIDYMLSRVCLDSRCVEKDDFLNMFHQVSTVMRFLFEKNLISMDCFTNLKPRNRHVNFQRSKVGIFRKNSTTHNSVTGEHPGRQSSSLRHSYLIFC